MKESVDPVQPFKAGEKLSVLLLSVLLTVLIYLGRTQLDRNQLVFWGVNALISLAVGLLTVLFFRLRKRYEENVKELARKEMELAIAQEVQQELFPRSLPPATTPMGLSAICLPARGISGDYYDFLEITQGQWGVAVADISGKGISAALLMANLQAMLRSQFSLHKSISELFGTMNQLLARSTAPNRYATLFYGTYQVDDGAFHYVNAGHVPPILVRSDGMVRLTEGGTPLGLLAEATYREGCVRLLPGDLLAIFSDGILEAVNGSDEEFGETRLVRVLSENRHTPANVLQTKILEQINEWSQKDVPDDDITLVLIKIPQETQPRPSYETLR